MSLDELGCARLYAAIQEWVIGDKGERDRELMVYRWIDGLTFDECADRYQEKHPDRPLHVDTIKRAVYKRTKQIMKHFPG